MVVRLKEPDIKLTAWDGIEITENNVINVLLREANNLIHVNEDRELYVDLQLDDWIEPDDDLPVGVTTGKILAEDWWQQNGIILNRKTTSWDYVRLIYANDWKLYYDPGTGVWNEIGWGGGWSINVATATSLWVIKLGSNTVQSQSAETPTSAVGRTYAVQLNSSNQALVNVPWEEYESLPEEQNWQDESLVTTGEKYTWNHKQDALTAWTNITISNWVISANITNVYTYKGSVASQSNLPTSGQAVGDVWLALDTGISYAWNGTSWISMGSTVDLTNYFNKLQDDSDDITEWQSHLFASPSEKAYWNGKQDALTAGQWITIDPLTNVISWTLYTAWNWINIDVNNVISNLKPFDPANAWATGQILRKTSTGYQWSNEIAAVTSVNGRTWAVTVSEFSPSNSGTTGQVLKKTSAGYQWANESWWGWGGTSYLAGYWIDITNDEISNTLAFDPSNSGTTGQVIKKTSNGYHWADDEWFEPSNTWTNWQVLTKTAGGYEWANAAESGNVKLFTLSSTSDLTTAQAAWDWFRDWKLPIIRLYGSRSYIDWAWVSHTITWNFDYYPEPTTATTSTNAVFTTLNTTYDNYTNDHTYWMTMQSDYVLELTLSWTTVTAVTERTHSNSNTHFLSTEVDYSTPYNPQYNGSPATKKYVDDHGVPTSGTTGYVLTKTNNGYWWSAPTTSWVTSVNWNTWAVTVNEVPSSGTTNYLLQKTADGYAWANALGNYVTGPGSSTDAHLAVFDGTTGKIIKDWWAIPTGFDPSNSGSTGQVLTKTAGGYNWQTPSSSAGITNVTTWTTSTVTGIWAGSEQEYSSLSSKSGSVLYFTF